MLSLPFRMDLIASDATIRQGWDLNRNGIGMTFTTNLNQEQPVTFDGKMDQAEKDLAKNDNTLYWGIGSGDQGTFMFKGIWDAKYKVKALLYYEDDLTREEPPEEDPGIMGFAYRLEDLLSVGTDDYPFNIINYVVPHYDGNVEKALRVYDKPLEASVK